MIQAYEYRRVSGRGQLKGTGIDRQHDNITAFATKGGYEIVKEYEDVHTGTEEGRPAFMEMLEAMMSNGVKVAIVESLDRLARDLVIQSSLLAKLASEGLTLMSATTGEDVTASMVEDPMRRALVQMQGVFAELDKRLLVRRLRKGRDIVKAKKGKCEGAKAFGELPGELMTLQQIDSMRKTMKPAEIAKALNEQGLPTRSGRPWNRGTVWKICKELAEGPMGRLSLEMRTAVAEFVGKISD